MFFLWFVVIVILVRLTIEVCFSSSGLMILMAPIFFIGLTFYAISTAEMNGWAKLSAFTLGVVLAVWKGGSSKAHPSTTKPDLS